MEDKFVPKTPEEVDIARYALGAYQGLNEDTPASLEVILYEDGTALDGFFGQVNPCYYGNQCEGHACYCDNKKSGYRKCCYSWYYGELGLDEECESFQPNPFWEKDALGDFYDKRDATARKMYDLGKLKVLVFQQGDAPPHPSYQGSKSCLPMNILLSNLAKEEED